MAKLRTDGLARSCAAVGNGKGLFGRLLRGECGLMMAGVDDRAVRPSTACGPSQRAMFGARVTILRRNEIGPEHRPVGRREPAALHCLVLSRRALAQVGKAVDVKRVATSRGRLRLDAKKRPNDRPWASFSNRAHQLSAGQTRGLGQGDASSSPPDCSLSRTPLAKRIGRKHFAAV